MRTHMLPYAAFHAYAAMTEPRAHMVPLPGFHARAVVTRLRADTLNLLRLLRMS